MMYTIRRFSYPQSRIIISLLLTLTSIVSCSYHKEERKDEEISISPGDSMPGSDSITNSIQGNVSLSQISTTPQSVILTGLADYRLVTVYKTQKDGTAAGGSSFFSRSYYKEDEQVNEYHFMPGIDLIFGYNLLNVAHYNFKTEKLTFLFNKPALIKSLYFPSFEQDSLDHKAINRDFYLISVYDEDTNGDTIINKKDLRRFYHFSAAGDVKTQIIPFDYSVVRSQYDSKNDLMYIFARHDTNKNGASEKNEPMQIFWINLKAPDKGKLLY